MFDFGRKLQARLVVACGLPFDKTVVPRLFRFCKQLLDLNLLLLKDLPVNLFGVLRALPGVRRLLLSRVTVRRASRRGLRRRLLRRSLRGLLLRGLLLRGLSLLPFHCYLSVVVGTLRRIRQDFVRFAESGEFFRRRRISRIHVGMKALCQQSVSAFYFVFRSSGLKSHYFIIVLHGYPTLVISYLSNYTPSKYPLTRIPKRCEYSSRK